MKTLQWYNFWLAKTPTWTPLIKRAGLNILGVRMSERLEFTPHVNHITKAAVQSTYALRVLRAHELNGPDLWGVTRATAVAKLTNACSAWCGGIWTLVVRRVSNQYLINSGALAFLWRIFHLSKTARTRTLSYFCRYCGTKNTCCTNCFRPWGMFLIPFAQGPMTARCQSPMPPWGRISFTACCIWTRINFLIVLEITGIFMNSLVLSVNFLYVCLSMLAHCICQRVY